MLRSTLICCVVVSLVWAASANAGAETGLKKGSPDLKSIGPLAFGPDGILFIGDPLGATIFAFDTSDTLGDPSSVELNINDVDAQIAGMLGTTRKEVLINDLAVNPVSGNAYLSVSRGRGPKAAPVLFRINKTGKLSEVSLKDVPFAQASLSNAPEDKVTERRGRKRNKRLESITDMAFIDGRLFIAGLSNEEFASKLRSISFPFTEADPGTSVEIFHGAHGRFETKSPVRTFVPLDIVGDTHLVAAYTCTPLVKFPISRLVPGTKLQGTTVAELGNHNNPLDMIVYTKDDKEFLLMANSKRGVMKISTDKIERADGITEKISDTAGQVYETITSLNGVVQLDRLNSDNALVLVRSETDGAHSLQTIALP